MSRGWTILFWGTMGLALLSVFVWVGSTHPFNSTTTYAKEVTWNGGVLDRKIVVRMNLWGRPVRSEEVQVYIGPASDPRWIKNEITVNLDHHQRPHGMQHVQAWDDKGKDLGAGESWYWHGRPVGDYAEWKAWEKRMIETPGTIPDELK